MTIRNSKNEMGINERQYRQSNQLLATVSDGQESRLFSYGSQGNEKGSTGHKETFT